MGFQFNALPSTKFQDEGPLGLSPRRRQAPILQEPPHRVALRRARHAGGANGLLRPNVLDGQNAHQLPPASHRERGHLFAPTLPRFTQTFVLLILPLAVGYEKTLLARDLRAPFRGMMSQDT